MPAEGAAGQGPLPLVLEGVLPCSGVVSGIVLEGRQLWAASTDGKLRRFEAARAGSKNRPAKGGGVYSFQRIGNFTSVAMGAPVLCLAVGDRALSAEDGGGLVVACGLADGRVVALVVPDGGGGPLLHDADLRDAAGSSLVAEWAPHRAHVRVRSVCVSHGAVFTGGSDGTVTRRWVSGPPPNANAAARTAAEDARASAAVDEKEARPLFGSAAEALLPPHGGAVVALCARGGGLLVSGAHDGTLRVWDAAASGAGLGGPGDAASLPRCLYGFGGYKVWLGSVATDGRRLVADGSDNKVLVHDFSSTDAPEPPPPPPSKRGQGGQGRKRR
jgi:hypothetical protein